MNSELVRKIKESVKSFGLENNVYYNFVDDKNIDKTKTYITYSKYSSTPNYKMNVASSVFDISVFSSELSKAVETRNRISAFMYLIENESVILETDIEEEKDLYDDEAKMHQCLLTLRVLHKI